MYILGDIAVQIDLICSTSGSLILYAEGLTLVATFVKNLRNTVGLQVNVLNLIYCLFVFLTFPLPLQTGLEISCWAPRVQTPNILPSQWCKTEKTYLLANSFLTDFLWRHKYKQLYLMRTNCWNTAFEQFPLYALNAQFLSWRKLMRWLFENVIAPISSVTHYLNTKARKTIN